jgi:hypothetical protein
VCYQKLAGAGEPPCATSAPDGRSDSTFVARTRPTEPALAGL